MFEGLARSVRRVNTIGAGHQHNTCGASAPYVRSINTICAKLHHMHKERIMGGVIAIEYIEKHKH